MLFDGVVPRSGVLIDKLLESVGGDTARRAWPAVVRLDDASCGSHIPEAPPSGVADGGVVAVGAACCCCCDERLIERRARLLAVSSND